MFNLLSIPTFFTFGEFSVALLDIVAVILLFFALIVGIAKGFAKQVLSLIGIVACLVLAYFFAPKLSEVIKEKVPKFYEVVRTWAEKFVSSSELTAENTKEAILQALKENTTIPEFLHEPIADYMIQNSIDFEKIIDTIAGIMLNAISFVAITLGALIVLAIVKKIVYKIVKLPFIKTIDKLLGGVFGVVKIFAIILIALTVISVFVNINSFLQPINANEQEIPCYLNQALIKFSPLLSKIVGIFVK